MTDTEEVLRHFLHKEMKIHQDDLDQIQFERVHRIPQSRMLTKSRTQDL